MKLSIQIKYETEIDREGETEETEEIVSEIIHAKAAEFAAAVRNQLAAQGVKDLQMEFRDS